MFAAIGLFVAGAVVSVWNGVTKLFETSEEASYFWAYVVLGIAFVSRESRSPRPTGRPGGRPTGSTGDVVEHALNTSDPTLRAVFAEDAAALVGLVIAYARDLPAPGDRQRGVRRVGSILVGILLGVVAVVLINRNRWFLTGAGEQTGGSASGCSASCKAMPEIDRVTYLRLEFVGPGRCCSWRAST